MADSKVTGMNAATSVASTDLLYLVKPNTSPYDFKVTLATLLGGVPVPVVLEKTLTLGGTPQTLSSAGAIDITTSTTLITSPDNDGTLTIADGVNGQLKTIIMTSNAGSHTLSITSNIGHTSISFAAAGATATLMFQGTVWYFVGGTATVA